MPNQPLFAGLIIDEYDNPVEIAFVGNEACYVVDDAGFNRHISSEHVDIQVLEAMMNMIEGHEGLISTQTAKMLGQEDPFSVAMIESQLKNMNQHFESLLKTGIPEDMRAYMGMMGFRIRINLHGDVLEIDQPGTIAPEDE